MEMIMGPSVGTLDADQLVDAYPWPAEGRWLRAMMVTTLDGASAGSDGLSGSISSEVDKSVFNAVRRLADVVLVGGGTVRAEGYGAMRAKPADADRRALNGQATAPVLAIVSGSLDLPWDGALFSESAIRPIVFTGPDHDEHELAQAHQLAEVIVCSNHHVSAHEVIAWLDQRGLRRIVCEGGPSLLEDVVAAGLLDEADISVSPMFAGTQHSPRGQGLAQTADFELRHVLLAEGFLMNRYVRATA